MIELVRAKLKCRLGMISMHSSDWRGPSNHDRPFAASGEKVTGNPKIAEAMASCNRWAVFVVWLAEE